MVRHIHLFGSKRKLILILKRKTMFTKEAISNADKIKIGQRKFWIFFDLYYIVLDILY